MEGQSLTSDLMRSEFKEIQRKIVVIFIFRWAKKNNLDWLKFHTL